MMHRIQGVDRWGCNSHVSRRIPCGPLQSNVASMALIHRGGAPDHICVLPDTRATLVMQLVNGEPDVTGQKASSCGWLLGAPTRTYGRDIINQPMTLVVTFKPGGALSFMKVPMHELTDVSAPLEDIWGARARLLHDRLCLAKCDDDRLDLVEKFLCDQLERCSGKVSRASDLIRRICERMRTPGEGAPMNELCRRSNKSERQLRRVFLDAVGLNPLLSWRIERFNRAVLLARSRREVVWTEIAAETGYFDQAHMCAEFRRFAGVAPGRFLDTLHSGFPHLDGSWFDRPRPTGAMNPHALEVSAFAYEKQSSVLRASMDCRSARGSSALLASA